MVTTSRRAAIAMAIAAGFAALVAGCGRPPSRAELQATFDEAERLCLDQRYDEARMALKAYLMLDPLHPGAHFYLGVTYLAPADIRDSALAEQEFQLALSLFERRGRQSGIKRYDARYFELMCNLHTANALYVQAGVLAQDRSLRSVARELLIRAQDFVERARTVNPGATEVREVEASIQRLAGALASSAR